MLFIFLIHKLDLETTKKILEYVRNPKKVLIFLNKMKIIQLSDKKYLEIIYKTRMGKKLNLDNPSTFNEKIQWLKLYDRKPEYTTMVDKYEVKKYIEEKIGDKYIIPTLGVWDKFDDIDFENLPEQFVLKCTHDSGSLVICKNKEQLDIPSAKNKLEEALKKNHYLGSKEWPYKNVKPRIIAEKYMSQERSRRTARL